MRARWPAIAASVGRSAAHCATAAGHQQALAALDAGASLASVDRLPLARLTVLDHDRRLNLLRCWCRARGVRPPPQRRLEQALLDLLAAGEDASPCIAWDAVQLRRYRQHLYLGAPPPATAPVAGNDDPLALAPGLGRLTLVPVAPGAGQARVAAARWRPEQACVRYRQGGERVRLPGREGTRALKGLLQEWGVVPWMRECLPLLCQGEQIVAIADLAVTAEFAARPEEPALEVRWEQHPNLY